MTLTQLISELLRLKRELEREGIDTSKVMVQMTVDGSLKPIQSVDVEDIAPITETLDVEGGEENEH